jgi:ABC-type polysaccharide/polyol phosphate transport system ATPase subunit
VHEALDHEFRQIVQERAQAILASGGIVIAAGHDHPMLARICQKAFYFEQGRLRTQGPFREVQRAYLGADATE